MTNDEARDPAASLGSVAKTKITARDCSAADWCRLNGWDVGTILEGDEGRGPERIVITAVGEESILAKTLGDPGSPGDRSWVLWCRDWKRVG
jgi:hypothetical protein